MNQIRERPSKIYNQKKKEQMDGDINNSNSLRDPTIEIKEKQTFGNIKYINTLSDPTFEVK